MSLPAHTRKPHDLPIPGHPRPVGRAVAVDVTETRRPPNRRGGILGGCRIVPMLVGLVWLLGCASAPLPAPPPAIDEARSAAEHAARLTAEQDWSAAAQWWARAARKYQLVNQMTNVSMALHNEGICRRAAGDLRGAQAALERAVDLNEERHRRADWWRNQIALLQIANDLDSTSTDLRLRRLAEQSDGPPDPRSVALLEHEKARSALREGRIPEALAAAERSADGFTALPDRVGWAAATLTRARALQELERFGDSREAWKGALAVFEAAGEPRGVAAALAGWGACLAAEAIELEQAVVLLKRAQENYLALGRSDEAARAERRWRAIRLPASPKDDKRNP